MKCRVCDSAWPIAVESDILFPTRIYVYTLTAGEEKDKYTDTKSTLLLKILRVQCSLIIVTGRESMSTAVEGLGQLLELP